MVMCTTGLPENLKIFRRNQTVVFTTKMSLSLKIYPKKSLQFRGESQLWCKHENALPQVIHILGSEIAARDSVEPPNLEPVVTSAILNQMLNRVLPFCNCNKETACFQRPGNWYFRRKQNHLSIPRKIKGLPVRFTFSAALERNIELPFELSLLPFELPYLHTFTIL